MVSIVTCHTLRQRRTDHTDLIALRRDAHQTAICSNLWVLALVVHRAAPTHAHALLCTKDSPVRRCSYVQLLPFRTAHSHVNARARDRADSE